jgi:hypothetical protein
LLKVAQAIAKVLKDFIFINFNLAGELESDMLQRVSELDPNYSKCVCHMLDMFYVEDSRHEKRL